MNEWINGWLDKARRRFSHNCRPISGFPSSRWAIGVGLQKTSVLPFYLLDIPLLEGVRLPLRTTPEGTIPIRVCICAFAYVFGRIVLQGAWVT